MSEEYYLSSKKDGIYHVYESKEYKLSVMEVLNLIKICVKERRSIIIGNKLLNIYLKDCENIIDAQKKLDKIGIKNGRNKATTTTKTRTY